MVNILPSDRAKNDTGLILPLRELDDRRLVDINELLAHARRVVESTPSAIAEAATAVSEGTPKHVLSVSAVESPSKQLDRVFSLVSVSFTRDGSDADFAGVKIWLTGYKGGANPLLVADGTESPTSFLLEMTGETVVVTAQAFGPSGAVADFATAPTTTVLLDGVISAPPAPTIASTLTSVPLGLQFAFNQLAGQAGDVIDSYTIYRHTADVSGSAVPIDTIKHNPLHSSVVVYTDQLIGLLTRYYWVSAVNVAGLESTLTAAHSGATSSGGVGSQPASGNAAPTTDPLTSTDAGSDVTITIAAFVMRDSGTDISITGDTITGESYNVVRYIYYDDPNKVGGAVTFIATATKLDLLDDSGRYFVGSIITALAGGSDTNGLGTKNDTYHFVPTADVEVNVGNGTVVNNTSVYDGTDVSVATLDVAGDSADNDAQLLIKTFSYALLPWQSLTLKIKSEVNTNSVDGAGTVVTLRWRILGGSWTDIFTLTPGNTRGVTIDPITLGLLDNVGTIEVELVLDLESDQTTGAIQAKLYKVWVVGVA